MQINQKSDLKEVNGGILCEARRYHVPPSQSLRESTTDYWPNTRTQLEEFGSAKYFFIYQI